MWQLCRQALLRAERLLSGVVLLSAVLLPSTLFAQLSGSYTIGSGGSYATFTAAASALVSQGVSGPVVFNVLTGLYNEQITIPAITGASAVNTITFQAATGNAANATLYWTAAGSGDNFVVMLNGAKHVRFHKMTLRSNNVSGASYGTIFALNGTWDFVTIDSTTLSGATNQTSASQALIASVSGATATSCIITGNTITNGGYGVYLYGVSTVSLTAGTQIANNVITGCYYGVYLQYNDAPVITGNTIGGSGALVGIQVDYAANAALIAKNKLTISTGGYGIVTNYCTGGTGGSELLIANNFVAMTTASGQSGIYVYGCSHVNVYYNSVYVTGVSSNSLALYLYGGTAGTTAVRNNILANYGGGFAVGCPTPSMVSSSDYNDLYTTGNFIAYWGSPYAYTLTDFRTLSSEEAHSVSYNPSFVSATDLHAQSPWIDGKAAVIASLTDDIDGQARSGSTPDIGADEFTPNPAFTTPLAGAYTIGLGGSYNTFAAAVNDLQMKGVSGPVTFNILNGIYGEHIVLTEVPGTSVANTVTFQANSGNAANATLYFFAAAPESNYVVKLLGAKYFRFHKMTLRSNNAASASYGIIFNLNGGWDHLMVDTTILTGATGQNSTTQALIATSTGATATSCIITGNSFSNAGYGIYLDGLSSTYPTKGTQVTNNVMTGCYYGIYLQYQDASLVNGNTISGGGTTTAIEVDYTVNAFQIVKNRINLSNGTYGIAVDYCAGGSGFPTPGGLIANNFITISTAGGPVAIYVYGTTYTNTYYNSVNLSGGSTSSICYYNYGSAGNTNNVENNVFANPGGGYCLGIATPAAVGVIDYNDFYAPGNFVGYWGSTYAADLPALRTADGQDAHSVPYNPVFVSASDLHAQSPWANGKATPIADVTDDIDGQPRDGSAPDVGADEFTPNPAFTTPMAGAYTIGGGGTYATFGAAVGDLLIRGVSAPVTFNVLSGTYGEHISLTDVPGSSGTNTVTFQANSGNAASATLYFFAGVSDSNYVVKITGARNLRFRKLTFQSNTTSGSPYGTVFALGGGWDNLTIDSSIIGGPPNTTSAAEALIGTTTAANARSCIIDGNTFANGGYGIYLYGVSSSYLMKGTQITNNTLTGCYYAIYLQYQDASMVNGNSISGAATNTAIEVDYAANSFQIMKNRLNLGNASYGIAVDYCTGGTGFPNPAGLIADNFVTMTNTGGPIGIYVYGTMNTSVYYNSVNLTGASTSSIGLYLYGGAGNTDIIENNILANTGGGYAAYIASPGAIGSTDHNDLYAVGQYMGYWSGAYAIDLAAYQAASGQEAHSVAVNPGFLSVSDLHVRSPWIDGKAASVFDVGDDIDGDARDFSTPDIGADEFTPNPALTTPMAGAYTIGGGGSYPTFNAAVSELLLRGVSAPVTFNVLTGTYAEHIVLSAVPGASNANIVTFQANTGNAANATLSYVTASADSNYVVKVLGGRHLKFHKMTLQANTTSGAPYSTIFSLNGGWDDVTIDSTLLSGAPNTTGQTEALITTPVGSVATKLIVNGNVLTNGGCGVYVFGINGSNLLKGTQVTNNILSGLSSGIFLEYLDAPVVAGNSISGSAAYLGIEVDYCVNGLQVVRNRLSLPNATYGITMSWTAGGSGTLGNPPLGLIANNAVGCGASGSPYGFLLYSCSNLNIYNNSAGVSSASTSAAAFYAYGSPSSPMNVVNNAFAGTGAGYAYYVTSSAFIGTSDYNDLYSAGTRVAYWNGADEADLAALKAASSKEAHSVGGNPGFFSPTNVYSLSPSLDSLALPLADVTVDLDGNPRDPLHPDIGAYEFHHSTTITQQLHTGWNMVSVPVTVADYRKTVLFPAATTKAFNYAGAYVSHDTLANRLGYWVKYAAPASAPFSGAQRQLDSISVGAGWNMIGSISYPIPRVGLIQVPPSIITSKVFTYSAGGTYLQVDTIVPGNGYWVKTSSAGKIALDVSQSSAAPGAAAKETAPLDLAAFNELTVSGRSSEGVKLSASLYYKTSQEELNLDAYELPPAPPEGVFDVRFASGRNVERFEGKALPIAVQGEGRYTLSWKTNDGSAYVLVGRSDGRIVSEQWLTGSGSVAIDASTSYALTAPENLPSGFALMQNYPNPFNPVTHILFSLAEKTEVTLTVYDLLGQEVASVIEGRTMVKGYHDVPFDGSNLTSGVYFYRLTAGSFTDSRKMILMK